jgi:hypothetical protein
MDASLRQYVGFSGVEKRRPLRRQPNDHNNFGSLLMLAVTAGAFLPCFMDR